MTFMTTLTYQDRQVDVLALLDSGSTHNVVSTALLQQLQAPTAAPVATMQLADQSKQAFTQAPSLTLSIQHHHTLIEPIAMSSLTTPLLLGMPWLAAHNPHVDWVKRTLVLSAAGCKGMCCADPVCVQGMVESTQPPACAFIAHSHNPGTTTLPAPYADYADVFGDPDTALPPHRPGLDCTIQLLPGAKLPSVQPLYKLSAVEDQVLKEHIKEQLLMEHITPTTAPHAAPIFFVKKPGATAKDKNRGLRDCVDYRPLNAITAKDVFPLPLIDELTTLFQGATMFSKIDLRAAYNQLRMAPGHEHFTAFRSKHGVYQYQVMPFGLKNAPSVFCRFIQHVLGELVGLHCVVYLDDIVVFSADADEHIQHVKQVLQRLQEHKLRANLSKCMFNAHTIEFCGLVVTSDGVSTSQAKVDAVKLWPTPTSVKAVRSFLGFMSFYRRFIKGFSRLAGPLVDLTKKDVIFKWTPSCQHAFDTLRDTLLAAPILRHPNPNAPFMMHTDASDHAMGATLAQQDPTTKLWHPVAFRSERLTGAQRNYSTYDKELLSVIQALQDWRHLLLNSPLIDIYTDHNNLLYFTKKRLLTSRHLRWKHLLEDFSIHFNHLPGSQNNAADALSRPDGLEKPPSELLQLLPSVAAMDPASPKVIADPKLQLVYLHTRHASPAAGHLGVSKTLRNLADVTWPNKKNMVRQFVQECLTCQQAKTRPHKPYGLLQPLPVPDGRLTDVTMDFVTGLPPVEGKDAVLVVVDRCTKMAHYIATTTTASAFDTALLYMQHVFKHHGLPLRVVSDRGSVFTSSFWQCLLTALGVDSNLSTPYHPQSDGQTERVNHVLEQYLRCFCATDQDQWLRYLPLAEFAYNASHHATTNASPFYLNYGYHPRADFLDVPDAAPTELRSYAEALTAILANAKLHIEAARDVHKTYADRKRAEHSFAVGGYALLSTEHLHSENPSRKLDFRRVGPFKILAEISPVSYRLDLPPDLLFHPVVHVSYLEPFYGPPPVPDTEFVVDDGARAFACEVVAVRTPVDSKRAGGSGRWEWQVHWTAFPADHPDQQRWWPAGIFANSASTLYSWYRREGKGQPKPRSLSRMIHGRSGARL